MSTSSRHRGSLTVYAMRARAVPRKRLLFLAIEVGGLCYARRSPVAAPAKSGWGNPKPVGELTIKRPRAQIADRPRNSLNLDTACDLGCGARHPQTCRVFVNRERGPLAKEDVQMPRTATDDRCQLIQSESLFEICRHGVNDDANRGWHVRPHRNESA